MYIRTSSHVGLWEIFFAKNHLIKLRRYLRTIVHRPKDLKTPFLKDNFVRNISIRKRVYFIRTKNRQQGFFFIFLGTVDQEIMHFQSILS